MTKEKLRAMYETTWCFDRRPVYYFDVETGDEPEEGVEFSVYAGQAGQPMPLNLAAIEPDVRWWRRAAAHDLAPGVRVLWMLHGAPMEVTIRAPERWEAEEDARLSVVRWATTHFSYFITPADLDAARVYVVMTSTP